LIVSLTCLTSIGLKEILGRAEDFGGRALTPEATKLGMRNNHIYFFLNNVEGENKPKPNPSPKVKLLFEEAAIIKKSSNFN
jgi:hypothetical protein